jgi:hypothetical protein
MIKYTPHYLSKLEDLLRENRYIIRNERGNFKSGTCLLRDQRTIVVNKFATVENRINALIEILRELRTKETLTDSALKELDRLSSPAESRKVSE